MFAKFTLGIPAANGLFTAAEFADEALRQGLSVGMEAPGAVLRDVAERAPAAELGSPDERQMMASIAESSCDVTLRGEVSQILRVLQTFGMGTRDAAPAPPAIEGAAPQRQGDVYSLVYTGDGYGSTDVVYATYDTYALACADRDRRRAKARAEYGEGSMTEQSWEVQTVDVRSELVDI